MKLIKGEYLSKAFPYYIFLFLFFSTTQARAQFLLEPYLGFHLAGSSDFDNSQDSSFKGFSFGSKVGGFFDGFIIALDLHHITGQEQYGGGDPARRDLNINEAGIVLGYQMESGIRFDGTYWIASSASLEPHFNDVRRFSSGQGVKIGVGYYVAETVTFMLHYRFVNYSRANDINDDVEELDKSRKNRSFMLTANFPIIFE